MVILLQSNNVTYSKRLYLRDLFIWNTKYNLFISMFFEKNIREILAFETRIKLFQKKKKRLLILRVGFRNENVLANQNFSFEW